jgi:DNA-binding protein HU-beta
MALQDFLSQVKTQLADVGHSFTNAEVREVVDTVFSVVAAQAETDTVRIPAFGTFKTKIKPAREARTGRNPSTGEPLEIAASPERPYLAFKASKAA